MAEFNLFSIKSYPVTFQPDYYYLWKMRDFPDVVYNLNIC